MTAALALLFIVFGFALLIKGADWLVEGASAIAKRFGVSQLVIGLTIVSFGTSAPELLVNLVASFRGSADIAIGNIVGSNIANTLLILGATAAVAPIAVKQSTVFKEIPFSLLASIVLLLMANDRLVDGYSLSELGRGDGLILIGFFIIFLYYSFGIRNKKDDEETEEEETCKGWLCTFLILGGLIALPVGGELTVRGAVSIASILGLSEKLIGLTIVALGTSLPELTTSVIAASKGKSDIAVGNIIGSNIFNIFWILGVSATINHLPFQPSLNFDLLFVVLSTVFLFVFLHTGPIYSRMLFWWKQRDGHGLNRTEGWVLLGLYVVYIGTLVYLEVTGA